MEKDSFITEEQEEEEVMAARLAILRVFQPLFRNVSRAALNLEPRVYSSPICSPCHHEASLATKSVEKMDEFNLTGILDAGFP